MLEHRVLIEMAALMDASACSGVRSVATTDTSGLSFRVSFFRQDDGGRAESNGLKVRASYLALPVQ